MYSGGNPNFKPNMQASNNSKLFRKKKGFHKFFY